MAKQKSQQPWTHSVQWVTWVPQSDGNQTTSPWQCCNNQAAGKAGKTRFIAQVILSVKCKRKPWRLKWAAVWPSCLLSTSCTIDGCVPRTSAIYLLVLMCMSAADTTRFSECTVCPKQSCYPSQAAKHLEFLGRFSRSLNSIWTIFLAGKGNVSREKFNIW